MNSLNAQQLAFILDIKKEDARAKLCHAWCKFHNIPNEAYLSDKKKIVDDYPKAIPIGMISQTLCIDNLQTLVDDIHNNYLNRAATKKWILCDYPENELRLGKDLSIPPALKTLLPEQTIETIKSEWRKRFPKTKIK
jgi:hypothetical protein